MDTALSEGIQLTRRRLTAAEATCLHEELKSTPNILGYTVPELLQFSDVLVATAAVAGEDAAEEFVGACLSKDLLFGWTDIAVLYVLPEWRGKGIGNRLYKTAFTQAQQRRRHIYTLSRSPQVIRLMEQLGMEITLAVWRSPLAVHLYTNQHMASWYRLREASRKVRLRRADGYSFVAGMKRFVGE